LYKIRDDVKLTSMKKIGVITVDERNLYRDVQSYISKKDITPTDFFYDKIKKSTYHAGENPILSYRDDSNLVVAKKDSDAFLENNALEKIENEHILKMIEAKNDYTYDHRNEKTLEGKLDKFMDNATRYFGKVTDRETYKYVNILEYVDDSYVITNKISDTNLIEMRNNMDDSDIEGFDKFVEENWGVRIKDGYAGVEEITKKSTAKTTKSEKTQTKAKRQTKVAKK